MIPKAEVVLKQLLIKWVETSAGTVPGWLGRFGGHPKPAAWSIPTWLHVTRSLGSGLHPARTFAGFSSSHCRLNFLGASSGSFLCKGGKERKLDYHSPNSQLFVCVELIFLVPVQLVTNRKQGCPGRATKSVWPVHHLSETIPGWSEVITSVLLPWDSHSADSSTILPSPWLTTQGERHIFPDFLAPHLPRGCEARLPNM